MYLVEEQVSPPYVKDMDGYEGGSPTLWPTQFDTTNWGLFWAKAKKRKPAAREDKQENKQEKKEEEDEGNEKQEAGEEKEKEVIGGACVAWNTPGVDMLERSTTLAVLWDLRVKCQARGFGVGACGNSDVFFFFLFRSLSISKLKCFSLA